MLDDLGLVHMNGRIYDGLLGRFLSADLLVDGVADLQGYNRYSYVKNRPLTLTDPSGHFLMGSNALTEGILKVAKGVGSAVASVVVVPYRAVFDNEKLTGEIADQWISDSAAAEAKGKAGWLGGVNRYNPINAVVSAFTGVDTIDDHPVDLEEAAANVTGAALALAPALKALKVKAPAEIVSTEVKVTATVVDDATGAARNVSEIERPAPKTGLADEVPGSSGAAETAVAGKLETALQVRDEAGTALTRSNDRYASAMKDLESAEKGMMDAVNAAGGDGPQVTVANEILGNAQNVAAQAELQRLAAEGVFQMAQDAVNALRPK